jgi:glycosyltransferase involved in cell wall biosynthesis
LSNKPTISLSVFFPCHNEQDNIERVVQQAQEVLPTISDDYEIIIVNDGSTDRTAEIADQLCQTDSHIRSVHLPENRGYGGALQSGFRAATKEWVFYTDGDGQFDLQELPTLLNHIENCDIVSCYRINRQDIALRKFNGWAWSKLVNLIFHFQIRDVDCAFKLFRRDIFDHIQMHSQGALIDAEILARAHRAGYRITQCGVHHYPRTAGEQSGANVKVILRAFKELFKLRKQIRKI